MSDTDLCYLSAAEALQAFKARKLSPVEVLKAQVARAEKVEPLINALPMTYYDRALEAAKKAEARYMKTDGRLRPLEGITVAIKDETGVKGEITTYGSLIYRNNRSDSDDPVVERLKRAGAIIHARSAAPEFGCVSYTHSRLWGVTRNPWNPDFTPGGSSGGAGAALAAGTATLANGSDIAGSIRIPASACGVVGYKPPYGRVPKVPPFNMDHYCHAGPLARTVEDCRLFENVIAGPHKSDMASLRPKLRIPDNSGDIKGWRIAVSPDLGYFQVSPEVAANTEAAIEVFRSLGAEVEQVSLSWTLEALTASWNYLDHIFGAWLMKDLAAHRYEMTDYARVFGERASRARAEDFLAALEQGGKMYAELGPLLERYRLLICPTLALPAIKADFDILKDRVVINGEKVEPVTGWCMTYPFNMLSRCPVMSIPSGFAASGVPTGIQLVGRTYDDLSVFRAAAAYEEAAPVLDWQAKRPAI